jgi:hypothetical protein
VLASLKMPRSASAIAALTEGNRSLSVAASVGDGQTPRQRRDKKYYENRKKKKRSRLLVPDTQPKSSSEDSGDFEGSVLLFFCPHFTY